MKLWYKSPAETWIDCLPLGNGKLGVMTDGGVFREKLYLNEDTLWSGYPTARDRGNPDAGKNLSKIREAVLKGRLVKADALLRSTSLGEESTTYLPLGTVVIDYKIEGQITDYSRELSLDRALAVSAFTNEQNRIEKRIFCSYPDKIVVMNIRSVRKISFDVTFQAALECTTTVEKNLLFAAGHAPETVYSINPLTLGAPEYGGKSMAYSCGVKVITDGKLTDGGEAFTVEDATDTLIVISAATGFRTFDEMPDTDADAVKSRVAALLNKKFDFDYLFERHLSDYTSLFKRVNLKLKRRLPNAAEYEDLPTDELLAVARKGTELPNALVELYYHYGRYLMIASSRTGSEPTTLQGLWNKDVKPAWNSNYTVNINTQMNYWAAGSSNLYECAEPFRRFVKELAVSGKKTAEQNLNASGFAAFHNSDLWRKTTPAKTDPVWAYFPMAGAWLANEVYSAYTYSAAYLSAKKDAPETREVLELLQSACAFLSDWLIPYKGCYITCPSTSPEHKFVHNLFFKLSADYASAIDMSIAWQLIENYKELCGILGIENRLLYELSEKQIKLFSLKSGKNGLLEWHTDYTPTEAGHRHFSPFYCLYPGNRVKYHNPKDGEWVAACAEAIEARMKNNGGGTGWSSAWAVSLYARLHNSNGAYLSVKRLLEQFTFPNLFDKHPPNIFQIDGNFGAVAGINEMLVQSENGIIELLPALPNEFRDGFVSGLVAKGGIVIDMQWADKKVVSLAVRTLAPSQEKIKIRKSNLSVELFTESNIQIEN